MLSPMVGQVVLGIYAGLLAAGGLVGFLKAKSRPSLIAGMVSALAALVALGLSAAEVSVGFPLGLVLSVILCGFFGYRFARKGAKFMPSGLMAIVSFAVIVVLIAVLLGNSPKVA
ncbi:TMEM14 family protein [Singulisphaera sp. PoT]|uniref:TMEM14 family protein n=1 Tax=Singulisphaera sp. PoT TaxID=3411797 RepID=UPI003BF5B075